MQKPSSVMVISLKHLAAEKYSSIYAGSLAKKIKNQGAGIDKVELKD